MKKAFRDLAIVVLILLALVVIGLIDIRLNLSPGEIVVCIAPVGSYP